MIETCIINQYEFKTGTRLVIVGSSQLRCATINKKEERTDVIEIEADLKVGKRFFNQTYKSFVTYYKNKDKIIVNNIEGPLKHLKNEWKFQETNNGCILNFEIDFELKNSFLNSIMKNSFDIGFDKIAKAFEKRAFNIVNN